MLGVGVWTLVEKGNYLSLLTSSIFAVSAYTLIVAGGLVVVTGFLGCCAVIREQKSCLSMVRRRSLPFFFGLILGKFFQQCVSLLLFSAPDMANANPCLFDKRNQKTSRL